MPPIAHHIPESILTAYAAGRLPHVFAVVVAAHVSLCDDCRAGLEAAEAVGGLLLDGELRDEGEASRAEAPADPARREALLSRLEAEEEGDDAESPPSGIFPGAVMAALDGRPPKWRMLGGGIRQCVLHADRAGSLRLLHIPPGRAVPDHGHNGLEMTLVLDGAFRDETGSFGPGDVELAEADLDHQPIAAPGRPCICLAATDAPLRFHGLIPRLLQPVFRI